MKYYCGLKTIGGREIFRCADTPTREIHGASYLAVIGPFRTKRGAQFMADYGRNNPHLQTVEDAERISKKEHTP